MKDTRAKKITRSILRYFKYSIICSVFLGLIGVMIYTFINTPEARLGLAIALGVAFTLIGLLFLVLWAYNEL